MAALTRLPATAPIEELLEAFVRDGGVIIEKMFDDEVISAIRSAADATAEEAIPGSADQGMGAAGREFVGSNTIRFSSVAKLTPAFFEMLDNELYRALADAVLLPHCGSYWLNTAQVMYIGPGEKAQALHRDADNWWEFIKATWPNSPEVTISAMIGLDHVTEELGATRVAPGSQGMETLTYMKDGPVDTVPAELGPGDALIYSGMVLHGGGANVTDDQWRRAMHVSFVAGWLTPEEAHPLDFALGELAAQSAHVQMILGHRSYQPMPHPGGGLWLRHVRAIEDCVDQQTEGLPGL